MVITPIKRLRLVAATAASRNCSARACRAHDPGPSAPASTSTRSSTTVSLRQIPGASARALAVVKANAYGHGAVAVARALAADADAFAVASTEEAMELRDSGIRAPIVLLEGVFEPSELELADRALLLPVVHNREQLESGSAGRAPRGRCPSG